MGRHGSAISEVNYSSFLSFLNKTKKGISKCKEDPATLVKDLLARQRVHVNE